MWTDRHERFTGLMDNPDRAFLAQNNGAVALACVIKIFQMRFDV